MSYEIDERCLYCIYFFQCNLVARQDSKGHFIFFRLIGYKHTAHFLYVHYCFSTVWQHPTMCLLGLTLLITVSDGRLVDGLKRRLTSQGDFIWSPTECVVISLSVRETFENRNRMIDIKTA